MDKISIKKSRGQMEFTDQSTHAYDRLENSWGNIFLTGEAGTGKSTLLQYFRNNTHKKTVVLAPTGVAAVNVKGQTIHSFFTFKPDITPDNIERIRVRKAKKELYKNIETIIIDEISMVRADLLDCIDVFLRKYGRERDAPFGGVQMVFIGDLYQLPPVVKNYEAEIFQNIYRSPYFFDAKVMGDVPLEVIELDQVFRQHDDKFINLLNAIRNNSASEEHYRMLNARCNPNFKPAEKDFYIHLTTTNALADRINLERLAVIKSRAQTFEGLIAGEFEMKNLPTHQALSLKAGAQVMLLNNDPQGRWVNGSIGKIISISDEGESQGVVMVELFDGKTVDVVPFTWEVYRFFYDEDTKALDSESIGSFTQYPLKLAWAVTIHKSQGKTFPKVIVDIGYGTFSHGQAYVALSRCTALEGLVLRRPILNRHILLDQRIVDFMHDQSFPIPTLK